MWGLGAEIGKEGGRGLPFSGPHLQEGSPVGCVEGVQRLLQPPLFREGPSPWARSQAQARALLNPLDVLPQASQEGACGTQTGKESGQAPWGDPA